MTIDKLVPLYLQVKKNILERILSHEWQLHSFIPPENVLTAHYGVSIGTLRKAIDELTHEKYLVRQQGRGTIVADFNYGSNVYPFCLFHNADGSRVYTQVHNLRYKLIEATEELALKLELEVGDEVLSLERLLYEKQDEDKYVVHDWVYVPRKVFPEKYVFKKKTIPLNLFSFYLDQKMRILRVEEVVSACMPDRIDVKHLNVSKKTPLPELSRVTFNSDNVAIEYRICRFDPNHNTYRISLT